jgi:hypothetical protein
MMYGRILSFLGMWMVVSTFLTLSAEGSAWNARVIGLLAVLFAAWWRGHRVWPKAMAMLVGVWLFASGSISRFRSDAISDANAVVAGILLIVAGLAAAKLADRVGVVPPPTLH